MKEYLKKIDICKALMVAYHLLFLGGSTTLINGYVNEIDKLRQEVVRQVDRAEKAVDKVNKTTTQLTNEVKSIKGTANKLTNELSAVKKACKRFF